jgi:hypothetical protein
LLIFGSESQGTLQYTAKYSFGIESGLVCIELHGHIEYNHSLIHLATGIALCDSFTYFNLTLTDSEG